MAKPGPEPWRAEMKPYVICHMNTSVDGRILGSRWRPAENRMAGLFERLLLEGGGGSNGSFLRAGLIDEISVAICPAVDGSKGAPSIFDSGDKDAGVAAPIRSMTLASSEVLEGGVVWLRYRLQNG